MTCIFFEKTTMSDGWTVGRCTAEDDPDFDAEIDCPNNHACEVFD